MTLFVVLGIFGFIAITWFYFSFVTYGMDDPLDELPTFCLFIGLFFVFPVLIYSLYDSFDGYFLVGFSVFLTVIIMLVLSPFILVVLHLLQCIAECISSSKDV